MRLEQAKHIEALMDDLHAALARVGTVDFAEQTHLLAHPNPSKQALFDLRLSLDVNVAMAFIDLAYALEAHVGIDSVAAKTSPAEYAETRDHQIDLNNIVAEQREAALSHITEESK